MLLILAGKQIFWEESPETPPSFSVILYGGNPQRWTAFDQGVRQACNDVGYAKPMIYVSEKKADYEGQIHLIEREIGNGAQGVIVACENSEQLQPYLEKIMNKTVIVPVLNGVRGLPCIQPDYEVLGQEVGQRIAVNEGEKVLVIENYMNRDSVKQIFVALTATLNQRNIDTTTHSLVGKEGMETSALVSLLEKNTYDVLVVLDNETMEAALVAKESIPRDIKLYGVGNSEKVIHALDKGVIQGLCFVNEFDAGYLSVVQMAEKLGKKPSSLPEEIQVICVTQEELYQQENERIIFPFY